MMGLLDALVDRQNAVSRALLQLAEVYLVPNMNPDGTWRGHLRVNGAGRWPGSLAGRDCILCSV